MCSSISDHSRATFYSLGIKDPSFGLSHGTVPKGEAGSHLVVEAQQFGERKIFSANSLERGDQGRQPFAVGQGALHMG